MKIAGILFFTLFTISIFSASALACKCIADRPFADEYNTTDAIFTGKVVKFTSPDAMHREYTFEVSQTWKGKLIDPVTVLTTTSSAACGYDFEVNEYYVVFAQKDSNGYNTGICSRTKLLKDASTDISALQAQKTNQVSAPTKANTTADEPSMTDDQTPAKQGSFSLVWQSIKNFFKRIFG